MEYQFTCVVEFSSMYISVYRNRQTGEWLWIRSTEPALHPIKDRRRSRNSPLTQEEVKGILQIGKYWKLTSDSHRVNLP